MPGSAAPAAGDGGHARDISRGEILARLRDPSLTLLDVLPRESYSAGHIPGAISLPADDVPRRAGEVLPSLMQEIAVYCAAAT